MVATKLSEVAGKGYEWYSGGAAPPAGTSSSASASKPPTGSHPSTPTRPSTLSSSLPPPGSNPSDTPSSVYSPWNYAQDSISRAAEQTYNTVAGAISSVYSPGSTKDVVSSPLEAPAIENFPLTPSPRKSSTSNASLLTSPTLLNFFHNPSVIVRGGRITEARLYSPQPSSMEAVRSLLQIVPSDDNLGGDSSIASSSCTNENNSIQEDAGSNPNSPEKKFHSWLKSGVSSWLADSTRSSGDPPTPQYNFSSSHSETASQLAEGTLRALRDIGLDEAVELHSTLRYWSYRWERPLLSWLEAGPTGTGKKYLTVLWKAITSRAHPLVRDLTNHYCFVFSVVLARGIST